MDEVRKSWWSSGLYLADSLRINQQSRLSRAWRTDSIFIAKEKGAIIDSDELPAEAQQPRILGMRKRNFYINLAVVSVLLSAFLAIGIFLGVNKYSTTTSSALYPGLAVSSIGGTTQTSIQVFYQNTTTNSIQYQSSSDGSSYSAIRTLQLSRPPKTNVSMAVTSFESQDFIFHQLFYVMDSKISVANVSCLSTAPSNCSIIAENTISTGSTLPVAKNSSIAAVYTQDGSWRIFYHSDKYYLSQIACTNGTWDTEGTMIGNKAVPGSGIAAVSVGVYVIEILYVDEAGSSIFAVEIMSGQWFSPSAVTTSPPAELSMSSSLAISYAGEGDTFQAFYTGTDSQIYEFIATNASSTDFPTAVSSDLSGRSETGWTNTPQSDETWVLNQGPGAPVASTLWADQVVFFQMRDDNLIQSSLNSTSGVWEIIVI